ncbi:MAG: cytochrome D1 domain-containing protein [Bryobacteraceae bacterium]|jgi:YVTN family beta-propeller protein
MALRDSNRFIAPAAAGFLAICCAALLAAFTDSSTSVGSHGWLLVANKGDRSMGIIDPASGRQVAEIPEGGVTGHEVVASPDGKLGYVPIYGNSGVGKPGTDGTKLVAIDLATRKVVGTLDFGHGVRPHCPIFGPKNGLLYVTTELDKTVSIIDPHTLKIVGTVPTGQPESHMLAITRDGKRGYTANVGPGTVSVLDLEARKTLHIIPISGDTQRISLSVDDRWAFTADQTQPRLAAIDTSTNQVAKWIALPASGYGTAPTPDGKWLVVAVPKTRQVAVVDLASMKVTHTIDVPAAPQEVLVRPDNQVAYVSCDASGKIVAIDIATWKVSALIDAGKSADGLAWAR